MSYSYVQVQSYMSSYHYVSLFVSRIVEEAKVEPDEVPAAKSPDR